MNKIKWIKNIIFNGVQTIWSFETITITKDNRHGSDKNFPYRLEINNRYMGDYRKLLSAKEDGIIFKDN